MRKTRLALLPLAIVASVLFVFSCAPSAPAPTPSPAPTPAPAPAPSPAPVIELKLTTFQPNTHALHRTAWAPFAEEVGKRSGGRIKVTVYPNSTLLDGKGTYDGIIKGVADLGMAITGYSIGRFPLEEITELPFLNSDTVVGHKVLTALFDKYFAKEHPDIRVLAIGTGGRTQLLMRPGKQVKTMADLKGLRIRSAGTVNDKALSAIGAVPVTISGPDTAIAMERGTVDGAQFPYPSAISFGLVDFTGWVLELNYTTNTFVFVMNKDVYNKLPADLKKIVDEVAAQSFLAGEQSYLDEDKPAIDKYAAKGITIYRPTPAEFEQYRQAVKVVYDEWIAEKEAKSLPARQLIDDFLKKKTEIEKAK